MTELAELYRSGWDGIGYMMAAENEPERMFLVVGEAFAHVLALRHALELHKRQGRVPFIRYYLKGKATSAQVKQELCRVTANGNTVVAELVLSLDVPNFFEQVMSGELGEYLRYRARLGCLQVLSKVQGAKQ